MTDRIIDGAKPGAPPLSHPLELIPFFRRWPFSVKRNLIYTGVWSAAIGLVLAVLNMLADGGRRPLLQYLLSMVLISLLIGYLIHGGTMACNRLFDGWPRRARGFPLLLFNVALVTLAVLIGISLGIALLTGLSPLTAIQGGGALVESIMTAAGVSLFMYMVRTAADRRIERETLAARQNEMMAASARLLAEARLRALQAQIEPHFLYNTLANVVSLIGPQPAQAQHMLERFIDYLRASLNASREERSTLGAETRLIAAYLDVLKVRMGDRLRYRIEVPDELKQFVIAPMLLQPVVENAIAHGLEPKVEGGEVVLSARVQGEQLCLQISDTGAGLSTAPSKPGGGVGLSNLRDRLRTLYDGAAQVQLLENQPCGMTVRLLLPLNASPTSIPAAP